LEVLVEDTLLSVVVTNLADSPTAALVRDSGGRVHFLLVASLVAEITAALVTVVSVDAVATFAILLGTLSISASMGSDIRITTRTTSLLQLRWVSKRRQFWRLPPSRSSDVTSAVQSALTKRGYYRGSIDGIIGPDSRRAIRAFQTSHGLPRNWFNRPRID
jgi:Putative peptidoglycan binding domain